MAKGDWWLKLDMKDWRGDVQLRRLKRENRASWLDACIIMRMNGDYKLSGTREDMARDLSLTGDEFDDFVSDLKRTGAADVTIRRNGNVTPVTLGNAHVTPNVTHYVTLVSRRYKKELSSKELTRLRVAKHRGNAHVTPNVTPMKRDIVNSKEKEVISKKEKNGGETPLVVAADAAAGKPDASQTVWEKGIKLLSASGSPERSARSLLGRLAKQYTEPELAAAINATLTENPIEPTSFLIGVLKKRAKDKAGMYVGAYNGEGMLAQAVQLEPCDVCGSETCLQIHREDGEQGQPGAA